MAQFEPAFEQMMQDEGGYVLHEVPGDTGGMTWKNKEFYGWHIDHIVPLSSAKTEEDVYKLCHYTNLQPLWSKDNMSKGSKLI